MNILKIFDTVKQKNIIVDYSFYDKSKNISYPSIIYFNGYSKEYGEGTVILFDFDRVLEIWSSEEIQTGEFVNLKDELYKETGLNYIVEKLDISTCWEDFNEYATFFIESGEVDIVAMNFEKKKFINEDYLNLFERSISNLSLISKKATNLIPPSKSILKLDIISSGKMLIFNIDTQEYVKLANKLNTEMEKKLLWLIINVLLKRSIMMYGKNLNPSPINRGMIGIFIEKVDSVELEKSLEIINEKLFITNEQIFELYQKYSKYVENLENIYKINQSLSNEKISTVIEVIENLLVDHILNEENSLVKSLYEIGNSLR